LKLIAGLGNPGPQYSTTRHNVGFMVVEQLAARAGISLKRKNFQGFYGVGRVAGEEAAILLPQTFMNCSGASVGPAIKSLGLDPGDLIVIHDDIDMPFGSLRIKVGGGHGGQNGLRDIIKVIGGDFCRIKVGIDRPQHGDVADYVLKPFASVERQELTTVINEAVDALEVLLTQGNQQAMNEFNGRKILNG
jgi:PTH1 family peptidyl-tRNA hydrolase